MNETVHPNRIVADVDVLVADVLVGNAAREALDLVRQHSWIDLVASDALLDQTETIMRSLTNESIAEEHRRLLESERMAVEHAEGDHPALGSALAGNAAHLLSFDDQLQSVKTGLSLKPAMNVSIRPPDAFVRIFDANALHQAVFDEPYPGPDRSRE